MVKSEIMYLGPLIAITHTSPEGISQTFFRNKWKPVDLSEHDLKHYAESGGFKVKETKFLKKVMQPIVEEISEEITIGG